jgi:hypothetical protein
MLAAAKRKTELNGMAQRRAKRKKSPFTINQAIEHSGE